MSTEATAAGAALRVRTEPIPDPGNLQRLLPDPHGFAWLRRGDGLVGWGEAARVPVGTGDDRFRRAAERLSNVFGEAGVTDELRLPGTGVVAFGTFTFDPRTMGSVLIVPEVVVGRRDGQAWRTTVDGQRTRTASRPTAPVAHARVRYAGSSLSEIEWLEAVHRAVATIRTGAYEKVVLARDRHVWSKQPFDARVLIRRLATTFPDCFTFSCDGLVGATPELLVRRTAQTAESTVLAGSAPRGQDSDEDARQGAYLLGSVKDREEHALSVESVRAILAGACRDLRVDEKPHLLRLANVQHLATELRGRLAAPVTALELAGRLHPTAAVCGTPTDVALEAIRALEGLDRSRYSGPVGWVDARGDGEWGIALRCAELDRTRARLFAGAGIVRGSLPEVELEETRLKLRAMQSAFEGHL